MLMPFVNRLRILNGLDRWLRCVPSPVIYNDTASAVKNNFVIVNVIYRVNGYTFTQPLIFWRLNYAK
jgi:hypothetical protein